MSVDKVLSSVFLSEFEIVSGETQPGSPGMVMGSRKTAPALRARPLRSYVPLRRVPSESVLSGTIPGLPGGSSLHPQIQFFFFLVKFSRTLYNV